jgi:hypothetical protein
MKFVFYIITISLLFFVAQQSDDFLDLTRPVIRKERPEGLTVRGGATGSPHAPPVANQLRITLLNLDAKSYRLEDDVTFEIRIENAGKLPLIIPWSDDYDRVKPDRSFPPGYLEASIRLIGSGDPGEIYFGSKTIYGSSLVPGSLKQLAAGTSIRIRGKVRLAVYDQEPHLRLFEKSPRTLEMKIHFAFSEGEFTQPAISINGVMFDLFPRPN